MIKVVIICFIIGMLWTAIDETKSRRKNHY